jgi:hypothetical protein
LMQAAERDKQAIAKLPLNDAMERVTVAEQRVAHAQARLDVALDAKKRAEEQMQVAQATADPQAAADASSAVSEAVEKVCFASSNRVKVVQMCT